MQVNLPPYGLRVLNDQPNFRPTSLNRPHVASTESSIVDLRKHVPPGLDGGPVRPPSSFEDVLHGFSTGVPSKTAPGASLLGEPPHADQLSTQVRDYRNTLNAANADLTAQLKAARQTLKDARQSGDQEAITAAQASVDGINVQLQANHDSLSKIHGDVKDLRELRQQLTSDVKTGNVDAIAQDRVAIAEQRQHVLADLQA